jgi:hypothetical protein
MRTTRRTTALGALALALCASAWACGPRREHAAEPAEVQAALRFEDDWLRALMERDSAALERILADDFVDVTWRGELHTKQDALRALAHRPAFEQRLDSLHVSLYEPTAVVRGVNVVSDSRGAVVARIRFTDVLVRTESGWRAVAAQETALGGP